ncbi:helix-turn-helix transcriptional regulator [Thalassobaculum sp. OXR-137]|uniref:helix-turn-helix transcriptional regulator n=1 Tax=Thalassobaculum sp. OXR-137 TaxID=3100173 RepID=UPI002AC92A01|nr:helix-turn-helix transcriptional regulator [Thalassobaculum sp. OXR-137]WPZ32722.1 helix-turn-helix transcriptional regulator [Thalassobaculum sp. OXR-137]
MNAHATMTTAAAPGPAGPEDLQRSLPDILLTLCLGIAVLDRDARTVAADRAFRQILEAGDPLDLRRGHIRAVCPLEDSRLQGAIAAVRHHGTIRPTPATVPLWGGRDHALLVSVHAVDMADGTDGRALMLMAVDTAPSVHLDHRFLKQAFQLTDAEAYVCRRLVRGDTLAKVAGTKGISIHTVRTQLKSIMQKVGVCRQSDLVSLLSRCDTAQRVAPPLGRSVA